MSWTNPLPGATAITGSTTHAQAFSALQAKYADASAWATWAATLMESQLSNISNIYGSDVTSGKLTDILALINAAPGYSPGSLAFTNTPYTSTLLTDLQAKLIAEIAAPSTGLGATVESAMFARATARSAAERLTAYNEVTSFYSNTGFDVPPGELSSKQAAMNNEASIRLTDVNNNILHETAVLAQTHNLEILKISEQLIGVLGALNDSQMMRNFEIQKVSVMQALDAYKAQLSLYEVKGAIVGKAAQLSIEAGLRTNGISIESYKGVAQSAAQMVASALNGINMSSSFGFAENVGTSYNVSGTGSPPAQ